MKYLKSPLIVMALFSCFNILAQSNTTEVPMDPDKSIYKNAKDSGSHDLLLAAVKVSDLETILDNDGPFTVFAPSESALDNTTKDKVTEFIRVKNKRGLQSVLGYHIIAGKLTASKILKALCRGKGKATFTTISGDILTATMNGLDIVLTDKFGNQSIITKADSNQCNGVFHVIDSVSHQSKA